MKASINSNKPERVMTDVSRDELQTVTGGSIDLDVPQCGNTFPVGPRPSTLGAQVIIPAVQNTWAGR